MPLLYLLGLVEWRTLGYLFVFLAAVVSVLELLRLFGGLEWAVYDELTREYEQDNLSIPPVACTAIAATLWLLT